MEELNENIKQLMEGVNYFTIAHNLAYEGKIKEAGVWIRDSKLPGDSKERILNALDTGDSHIIQVTFRDYALALGQAFCESCNGRG